MQNRWKWNLSKRLMIFWNTSIRMHLETKATRRKRWERKWNRKWKISRRKCLGRKINKWNKSFKISAKNYNKKSIATRSNRYLTFQKSTISWFNPIMVIWQLNHKLLFIAEPMKGLSQQPLTFSVTANSPKLTITTCWLRNWTYIKLL